MASIIPNRRRDLEGKVAIITGGASGIGAATAKLFVQNGAKVIVADIQDERGESLCKTLGEYDDAVRVSYVHCDVSSEADVKNVVDTAMSKYGKLDIMYCNAGVLGGLDLTIQSCDVGLLKRVMEVNVYGAFLGAKHAARVMIPAKTGVILFTASTATVVAGEGPHAYTASKHAVYGLMRNLNVELGPHGIRVNCVSPGAVLTPLLNNSLKIGNGVTEKILNVAMSKGGVSLLDPEEVARATVFLSSDGAMSVSGLNFIVDKGGNTGKTNMSFSSGLKDLSRIFSFIK